MTALIAKDLRQLAPWAWLIVPGHALFAANGIFSPELFFWMNVVLAGAFTVVLLVIEWRLDAERFVASLPVSRADVVAARYVAALGAAVVATGLYGLYGRALTAIGRDRLARFWGERTPGWESWEGLLAFLLVVALVSLAFLPFHFRLGFGRGSAAFLAVALPAALVGGLAVRWRVGEAARPMLPGEATRAALAGLSASWGPRLAAVLVLVVVFVAAALSFRLSVRFYEGRDL